MAKIDKDSDEFKAAVAEAIEEETRGLKAKRDELLGDNRKLKDAQKALQTQMDALQETIDESEKAKANKDGDVVKVREQLEAKHAKEVKKLTDQIGEMSGRMSRLVVANGLTEALTKSGVNGAYLEAASALIQTRNKIEIVDVDGVPQARIGDKDLGTFVGEWAKGEQGKFFTSAPGNSGGGAKGDNGKGNAGAKQMTRAAFDALPVDEKSRVSKEGVQLTEQ